MSIRFKIIEKGQPGVPGGGTKKFYAQVVTDGEVTMDELVRDIEKFSALSEPDIRGVVTALENIIQNKLADSKIVRLDQLGSLYPAISSEGVEKRENATQNIIKEVSINYRPGDRLKKFINDNGFMMVK